jgi:hypothetical protein
MNSTKSMSKESDYALVIRMAFPNVELIGNIGLTEEYHDSDTSVDCVIYVTLIVDFQGFP